ncbi:LysR family transcriptional regulator [Clostridiales bacterium PH28_bin88]|nr:LysR family transcriptional regulator [Clostridiales bacterium PH28_bin88]
MTARKVYLDNQPLEDALAGFLTRLERLGALQPGEPELVAVDQAVERVTAAPVYAAISSPHYAAAAMDGVAMRSWETFGAAETSPKELRLGSEAIEVDTGDPLPEGFDAVVMAEDLAYPRDGMVEVTAAVAPGQHVRQVGEDVVVAEMLLPGHHLIGPYDLGGLMAGGVREVLVHTRPRVAVLPTGDELIPAGESPRPGQILEYNSHVLAALVQQWGGQAVRFPITRDHPADLRARLLQAVEEADLVLVNAGSSAGREDFTAAVVRELGEVFTHGVAIKPGKPVILGTVRGKGVVGIPGYPVSAALACELFVKPVVYHKLGLPLPERPKLAARLARKVYSPLGQEEFLRVKLGRVGDRVIATPISRGAGVITSLMRADGILRVPRLSEGFAAGEEVQIELLRPAEEILQAVVVIGSHDLSLDVLAHHLHRRFPELTLSSANVGSLGGLVALRRGEAHCAGVHLLDPATGTYNETYIPLYLPGEEAVLVNLAYRQQGLMVAKGNPAGINRLADLARPGIRFVNRQRGAGTRILLDYLLEREGIDRGAVQGYDREEFTHLAVAVAVASGSADAGMGILAAAQALGLDFIPVTEERYDLCIPLEHRETPGIRRLLEILQEEDFRRQVEAMGGYDLRDCGQVVYSG